MCVCIGEWVCMNVCICSLVIHMNAHTHLSAAISLLCSSTNRCFSVTTDCLRRWVESSCSCRQAERHLEGYSPHQTTVLDQTSTDPVRRV